MRRKPEIVRQTPEQEVDYLLELHADNNYSRVFEAVIKQFDVLQGRAQLLLGLITICLTITGFSGPKIAASNIFSRLSIGFGLLLVLLAAVLILMGPLQLRWGTGRRAATIHDSLAHLIERRNERTRKYHWASLLLVLGLTGYVSSLLGYLVRGT